MGTDFNKLRLKYHGDTEKMEEILQLECRHKCAKKLRNTLKNESFRFPSIALAEMCTSDDVAEIHASFVPVGSRVLDMTAGLGIDSFHIAKRGCSITAVELDQRAAETLEHNASVLGVADRVTVINADSVKWLEERDEYFDVVFIDPARRDSAGRHFSFAQCLPDITQCLSIILSHCNRLIIKASPMIDIEAAKRELRLNGCNIVTIGTRTECKEVVLIIDSSSESECIECHTVGEEPYCTTAESHERLIADRHPRIGDYILIPFPSVMKGTGGQVNGYHRLHPNTHLYLANEAASDFPGQRALVVDVLPFNKASMKSFREKYPKINVSTRNFPLSAPELCKRLKVTEGGELTVYGTTLYDGSKALVVVK